MLHTWSIAENVISLENYWRHENQVKLSSNWSLKGNKLNEFLDLKQWSIYFISYFFKHCCEWVRFPTWSVYAFSLTLIPSSEWKHTILWLTNRCHVSVNTPNESLQDRNNGLYFCYQPMDVVDCIWWSELICSLIIKILFEHLCLILNEMIHDYKRILIKSIIVFSKF